MKRYELAIKRSLIGARESEHLKHELTLFQKSIFNLGTYEKSVPGPLNPMNLIVVQVCFVQTVNLNHDSG